MAAPRPWTVDRHDPIEKLAENLWEVEGDIPGMGLRRRMTVVKLADGRLVVHNAIALEEGAQKQLEAWGEPAVLIVPNGFHRLDAHAYKVRYPKLRVVSPPTVRAKVEEMVAVDETYDTLRLDDTMTVTQLDGVHARLGEGAFTVKHPDGTATMVFNDALFNQPDMPGFSGWVMKMMGSTGGPRVTPMMRMVGVRDRGQLAAHLRVLATTPGLTRLIPGHGRVVDVGGEHVLATVASQLAG